MRSLSLLFLCLSLRVFLPSLHAREEESAGAASSHSEKEKNKKKEEPPKIGNFSLPGSQQPSGLFAFGANIIDAGEVQIHFFADEFVGSQRIVTDVIPGVLFGVTEDFSIFFNFPFTPIMREDEHRSSGFEDFFVQLEYAFFEKKTSTYVDEATVLGSLFFPTGSVKKVPPTGFGSPSFFLGATYYHTTINWTFFTCQGALLTTCDRGTKLGDQFLYQFGFVKNIPSPPGWIYAWMIEVDGQYYKKNRIKGEIDPNSGGNVLYVTPSFWISSKYIIAQFGISFPITQNWFGKQHRFDYALNLNIIWSFY